MVDHHLAAHSALAGRQPTPSHLQADVASGLWDVRPPWHVEHRPENVSGARESRWLVIVDRLEVSYCEGWNSRTRAAIGPLSLALAAERHQAGEQYAVLLAAAGRPLALIEVALGELHFGLRIFDEQCCCHAPLRAVLVLHAEHHDRPRVVNAEPLWRHQWILHGCQVAAPVEQQVCLAQRGRKLHAQTLPGRPQHILAEPVAGRERRGPSSGQSPDELPGLPAITKPGSQSLRRIKTAAHACEATDGVRQDLR